jgi:hypothetical protein
MCQVSEAGREAARCPSAYLGDEVSRTPAAGQAQDGEDG